MPMSGKTGTAQIPGYEPFGFPRFLGRGSFLSPGRALRLLAESALAIPSPRFSILCLVYSFRFRELISIRVRHSSVSHGHPSGNARGGIQCLTHPPVRARDRREEKRRRLAPCKIKFLCMKLRAQFFQFVLFYFPFRELKDILSRWHPKHEEIFQPHHS